MIEKSNLPGGNLPDGTSAANDGGFGASGDVLKKGYSVRNELQLGPFDPDTTGENQVGDPFNAGGFLGRPRGTAR